MSAFLQSSLQNANQVVLDARAAGVSSSVLQVIAVITATFL